MHGTAHGERKGREKRVGKGIKCDCGAEACKISGLSPVRWIPCKKMYNFGYSYAETLNIALKLKNTAYFLC